MIIAIKFHDDEYYKNEYYSKVGGISLKELNKLESEFLNLIGYSLFVEPDVYSIYINKIYLYDSEQWKQ